jgi:hypothetical protein
MRSLRTLPALLLASCVVLVSGSALGQTVRVSDPAGDGLKGRSLDITAVRVANRDHAIVVTISVVQVVRGDLGVRMRARGDDHRETAAVLSTHRAHHDTNRLFTVAGEQPCRGLRVRWDRTQEQVRVRVPSRCVDDGNYGALRVKVIFEIGSDADVAPQGPHGGWRYTDWVSRG